ncbi:hypothetical protein [Massilia antarctica]|uniref:hypothetical protein n=1 Tax=Massilia antarctica TaxID=2765360 RepID=UPI0006BC6003|nr:hypothetical protein [Massilia sp. H27-R4]MCY0912411.1 hypothetical protein [Massilia sp. H27-R4]CUI03413.1 hypothetical protein BN2497_1603 [Janthinobacterium sp. CG23_2]CUU27199.1 hypothetical protein BN3177_1603 [Janthinobacterium sp. CG23_2]
MNAKQLPLPVCGVNAQGIHDRVNRDWRNLDFVQQAEPHRNSLETGQVLLARVRSPDRQ